MVLDGFCKSIKTIPVKRPFSNSLLISSLRCLRQMLIEEFFLKPDLNLYFFYFHSKIPVFGHGKFFH